MSILKMMFFLFIITSFAALSCMQNEEDFPQKQEHKSMEKEAAVRVVV